MSVLAPARPASAAALAAATPAHRDRVVDLMRAVSLAVVVVGHWLIAAVGVEDGELVGRNVLADVPATQWLTWLLQVMPLFFLVGGYSNAASWEAARRRGATEAARRRGATEAARRRGAGLGTWLAGRVARLTRPTVVFVAAWTLGSLLAVAGGVLADQVAMAGRLVALPLWFLAVYLAVVATTPAMHALHRRVGLAVPVALAGAALVVDLTLDGWAATVNFALVWLALHQLGFVWRDGGVARRHAAALVVGGLAALVVLTTVGGYPRSMVGVPGAAESNNSPPSVALVALGCLQLGLVLAARPVLDRWLARPKVWTAVVAANGMAMTVYLWHLTAVVVAAALLVAPGRYVEPAVGTVGWWALRPVWVLLLAALCAPLVALFVRFERGAAPRAGSRALPAVVGAVAVAAGLALVVAAGFPVPGAPLALPAAGLLLLTAGLVTVARASSIDLPYRPHASLLAGAEVSRSP